MRGRRVGRRVAVVTLAILLCAPAPAGSMDETELKATFVYNFLRMVNWPAPNNSGTPAKITICALRTSELVSVVRAAVRGKSVAARVVAVTVTSTPSPQSCQALIVENEDYDRAAGILKHFSGSPVLTIGDGPGFLKAGGMFELVVVDHQLLFNAGLDAVRRSKLEVSARVLRLAKNVQEGENGGG